MGQRAGFLQRARLGHGAGKGRGQRHLVSLFALHRQFQRFGFGFEQQFGGLARALGLAFTFTRQRRHAGVGAGDVQHFVARGMHCRDPLDRLQARLLGVQHQLLAGTRGLLGHRRFGFDLFGGAAARLFLGFQARLGGQLDLGIGFHAGAQFGGLLAHGFQPFQAGLGGQAQGVEAVAVRFDGVFRRLCILQGGGGGRRVHRCAFLGQAARARFGVGPAFGGAGSLRFGFDAGDRFVNGAHLGLGAPRRGAGRRFIGGGRQRNGQVGVVVRGVVFHCRSRYRSPPRIGGRTAIIGQARGARRGEQMPEKGSIQGFGGT